MGTISEIQEQYHQKYQNEFKLALFEALKVNIYPNVVTIKLRVQITILQ